MEKPLTGTILPDSSKLAEELLRPLFMVVAISLIAVVVGSLDIAGSRHMPVTPTFAMNHVRCLTPVMPEMQVMPATSDGFILINTRTQYLKDACQL